MADKKTEKVVTPEKKTEPANVLAPAPVEGKSKLNDFEEVARRIHALQNLHVCLLLLVSPPISMTCWQ